MLLIGCLYIEERHIEVVKANDETTIQEFRFFPENAEEFVDHQSGNDHDVIGRNRDTALRLQGSGEDFIERL